MKTKLYSVYDSVAMIHNNPYVAQNDGIATRSFKQAVNDSSTHLYHNPHDYKLVYLGEFNTDDGTIKSDVKVVCTALSVKEPEREIQLDYSSKEENLTKNEVPEL